MIDRYPLTWPAGRPRTRSRISSRFQVSLSASAREVMRELKLLGATDIILSSNMPTRQDGLPYAQQSEPADPGIAVWFRRRVPSPQPPHTWTTKSFVVACDTYRRVRENMRAIAVTVAALRTIDRHGAGTMLEQAFSGFAALPPAGAKKDWWDVLGVPLAASPAEVRTAYFALAKIHHPDAAGGNTARMAEINAAYAEFEATERRTAGGR